MSNTATQPHLEIWFTTGRRTARHYSYSQHRSMPLPLAQAEAMIAQGFATRVEKPEWA